MTATAEHMFKTILDLRPKNAGEADGTAMSREEKVKNIIEDLLDKIPEEFNIPELMSKVIKRFSIEKYIL